ncbi:MAG: isoaspartyl peptidase/L-asparaginase [Alphaproteobacteria bacterium]|nr:isoaspartyl peptidase/L-asparaginase [Alphaproteobacteria bacterium]
MPYALVLHGGAGARPEMDYTEQVRHLTGLIADGRDQLAAGGAALDTVCTMVEAMEISGLYVAGKGSAPNTDGVVELDASVMNGADRRAGAVSAIRGVMHPVAAARRVLEDGRHVMLTGEGATAFADNSELAMVDDPAAYYVEHTGHGSGAAAANHGTVGAVALDLEGGLAAATSTGGTFNKRPGRVGDTPLIGSGTWADDRVAVSCTGSGENFIRAAAAHDVAARMQYGAAALPEAVTATLAEVARLGGAGGIIAVDRAGNVAMPFNSQGMKRAAVTDRMAPVVRVFEREE